MTVRDSVVARSGSTGFEASDNGTELNVENSITTKNGTGLESDLSATLRPSNVMGTDNIYGLVGVNGTLVSWGNNRVAGNTTAGMFSSTIPQQ